VNILGGVDIKAQVGEGGTEASVAYGPIQVTYKGGGLGTQILGFFLFLLGGIGIAIGASMGSYNPSSAVALGFTGFIFIVVGLMMLIRSQKAPERAIPYTMSLFPRHDIIVSTNWFRLKSKEIIASETKQYIVKSPDSLFLHAFHTAVRHMLENLGYVIESDVSPAIGMRRAGYSGSRLFLMSGIFGYKYKNKKIKIWVLEEGEFIFNKVTGILFLTIGITADKKNIDESQRDFRDIVDGLKEAIEKYTFGMQEI